MPRAEELLLLSGDRPGLALAGARVGVRALAADREALAMTKPAIAGEVHQTLDVHRRLAPQVALDHMVGVDRLADVEDFLVGQVLDPALARDPELGGDFPGLGAADAVNVGKGDLDPLVGRDVDARDTCHGYFLLLHRPLWHRGLSQRFS